MIPEMINLNHTTTGKAARPASASKYPDIKVIKKDAMKKLK